MYHHWHEDGVGHMGRNVGNSKEVMEAPQLLVIKETRTSVLQL